MPEQDQQMLDLSNSQRDPDIVYKKNGLVLEKVILERALKDV
jgi:hypothetical protein